MGKSKFVKTTTSWSNANTQLTIFKPATYLSSKRSFSIKKLLVNKFSFTPDQAEKNLLEALEKNDERIEIFSQIKIILNEMDHAERIDVIEMMWGVILSDGVVDDFEANLMRRMNGLLYVSGAESASAKQRALSQNK